jgi:hypothetical protein
MSSIPEVKGIEKKDSSLILESKDITLNNILKNNKIKSFRKAFPTIEDSDFLKQVYYLQSNDKKIYHELKKAIGKNIKSVDSIRGVSTGYYEPNDYRKSGNPTHFELVKLPKALELYKNLPMLPIGVVELESFDITHEDLKNKITYVAGSRNYDKVHGTAVAGLLGAESENNIGIASISYKSKMFAITSGYNYQDDFVLQLAQQGYKQINCSWFNSCSFDGDVQDTLYRYIKNKLNCVVVFGAANKTSHCGSLSAKVYPASLDHVISVSSVGHGAEYGYIDPQYPRVGWKDVHNERANDPTTAHHHNDAVDIVAPGHNVPSTYNGGYGGAWGTSFAAPMVTGTVAVIRSINPCLDAQQAIDILLNTADASIYNIEENKQYAGQLGKGRLDVYAAVLAACESAKVLLNNINISTSVYNSNYGIVTQGSVNILQKGIFNSRNNFEVQGAFEVKDNSTIEIFVDPNLAVVCP